MPVTRAASRARSIAPRFDSTPTPSPRPGARRNCSSDSLSFSYSDDYETTMPETLKRKDETQKQKRPHKPVIDQSEVIEISDDDDDPPRDSQTTMIADFRRQISKLREV